MSHALPGVIKTCSSGAAVETLPLVCNTSDLRHSNRAQSCLGLILAFPESWLGKANQSNVSFRIQTCNSFPNKINLPLKQLYHDSKGKVSLGLSLAAWKMEKSCHLGETPKDRKQEQEVIPTLSKHFPNLSPPNRERRRDKICTHTHTHTSIPQNCLFMSVLNQLESFWKHNTNLDSKVGN